MFQFIFVIGATMFSMLDQNGNFLSDVMSLQWHYPNYTSYCGNGKIVAFQVLDFNSQQLPGTWPRALGSVVES